MSVRNGLMLSAALFGACLFASAPRAAIATATKAINDSGLDGYWEIDDSSRRNQPRPEFTPAADATAKANAEAAAARVARGEVVGLGTYTCGYNGAPNFYTTSEPFALVLSKDEVVLIGERPGQTPRHFYTDGRSLPDLTKMPPSSSGYSVAHWEGKDLVVETRGLPTGGAPGGGLKGPGTIMRERFSVIEGGKRLKATFTMEDPALYTRPFTLEYLYDRSPPHTYAYGDFCDPNEDRAKLVKDPVQ